MDRPGHTEELLSAEEIRKRQFSDPEVKETIAEVLEEAKNGEGAGIKEDELPDFLREHH